MRMAEEKEGLLEKADRDEEDDEEVAISVVARDGSHPGRRRDVTSAVKLPLGIWLLERMGFCRVYRRGSYKVAIYILTFCCYASYHLSRKPISVVKVVLCPKCANENITSNPGWPPFDGDHAKTLLGSLDYSYLFAYAIAMFFSGWIADRMNLRIFLTIGMLGSGITCALLGVADFAKIHHLAYFIVVQVFGGILQSTGWPGVVAVMSHWFGKSRRGFIMGIWNAHTSVGNILGTVIPSFWADSDDRNSPWGWSFFVPAFIISGMGVIVFFFLVTDPTEVGLQPPVHHLNLEGAEEDEKVNEKVDEEEEDEEVRVITPEVPLVNDEGSDFEVRGDYDNQVVVVVPVNGTTNGHGSANVEAGVQATPPARRQKQGNEEEAVGFLRALKIPGVIEYSVALFFNKLVSYTFLYWLPLYVAVSFKNIESQQADWLSTLFDVGGIIGGIAVGVVSDWLNARAISCVASLILAIPSLFVLRFYGTESLALYMVLLIICGIFINGPYGIITTAVSSDLGTHRSLRGNQNAKATVTAIIDGTGSIGAALGPLLFGLITDSQNLDVAFYVLMASCFLAAVFLLRLVKVEVTPWIQKLLRKEYILVL